MRPYRSKADSLVEYDVSGPAVDGPLLVAARFPKGNVPIYEQ
jgi:hypothetical protein